jgi:hypothetical protein
MVVKTLYHRTNVQAAVAILRSQEMRPGAWVTFGAGIYFGDNIDNLRNQAQSHGVVLSAEVDLGTIHEVNMAKYQVGEDWGSVVARTKCDSVKATLQRGTEYIVYEAGRVKNIKLVRGSDLFAFTGQLWASADGTAGKGKSFRDYQVKIVKINERASSKYPILLGDAHSSQLGWVPPESIAHAG